MFLKRNRRSKNGETYEYWSLVQTVRTAKGPRHRTVCNLGKLPGLDKKHRHGWENLINLLEGTEPAPKQQSLGGACMDSHTPEWMHVDVKSLRVERVRDFGEVYLALALWRRLGLHSVLEDLMPRGREKVAWPLVACVLVIARFCGNKSELEVAERWYQDSALPDLLGLDWKQVYDNPLYRGLDALSLFQSAVPALRRHPSAPRLLQPQPFFAPNDVISNLRLTAGSHCSSARTTSLRSFDITSCWAVTQQICWGLTFGGAASGLAHLKSTRSLSISQTAYRASPDTPQYLQNPRARVLGTPQG